MAGIQGNPFQAGQIGFNPYAPQQQQPQQAPQQQQDMPAAPTQQDPSPVSADLGPASQGQPAAGGPLGGLAAAAPTGASSQAAATSATQTMPSGLPNPNEHIAFSGPNALRQGIGQRNPPNLSPVLTGLRNIY